VGQGAPRAALLHDFYRELFERARDAIVVFSPTDETVLEVNPRACELYGLPRREFLGMSLQRITHDRARGRGKIRDVLEIGFLDTFESLHYRSDGTPMLVEITASVCRHDGELAILSINRDVTARRASEARERRMIETAAEQGRLVALGELAAGVAHDFNNILQSIQAIGGVALGRDLDPEIRRYFDDIAREGQRAARVVRQVLDFARQTESRIGLVDLRAVVQEAVDVLRNTIGRGYRIELGGTDAASWVHADSVQVQQVLTNLVLNARDALEGRPDPTIYVSVLAAVPEEDTPEGPWVALRVRDHGPGVPLEVRDRIYDPFFTTKAPGRGTGLGLSQVHGIVRQHGGHVRLRSIPGDGAEFTVLLPPAAPPAVPG
jgi:PAS domain S-box-containing protein